MSKLKSGISFLNGLQPIVKKFRLFNNCLSFTLSRTLNPPHHASHFVHSHYPLIFFSCKDKEINFVAASCYPELKDIKRREHVVDFPVTVQLSGGLVAGGRLMVIKDNAWSACNLPEVFLQDSLALYVSGYLLTSPSLEVMNLVPVPFEVTSAKLR